MIITFSGCDGVGKTTHTRLLAEKIAQRYHLSAISLYDVVGEGMCYNNISELEEIYTKLEKYDVIVSRFYLKGNEYTKMQNEIRYSLNKDIFENTAWVREAFKLMKKDVDSWFDVVISKLLAKGKIVIFDRYFYDEFAYRHLYSLNFDEMMSEFSDFYKPDISFLFKANLDTVKFRNKGREDSNTILFKEEEKIRKLLEVFETISKKYNLIDIDINDKEISDVSNRVYYYCELALKAGI